MKLNTANLHLKFPCLLILKGKHANYYFHATNEFTFVDCLARVFDINEENDYYYFDTDEEVETKRAAFQNELEGLEKIKSSDLGGLIQDLDGRMKRVQREMAYLLEERRDKGLYDAASAGDADAKALFAWRRRSGEYEELEIESYS